MLFKNFSPLEIVFKMPLRFVLDCIAALAYLMKGQPQNMVAVVRAQLAVLGSANSTFRKRRIIRKAYRYSATNLYHGIILFDYYIRRGKIFTAFSVTNQ
jgi:hypothetical protein